MNPKPPSPTNDPQPENQDNSEEGFDDNEGGSRFLLFNVMPSWLVSFLCHIAIIIVLAILVMPTKESKVVSLQAGEQAAEALDSFEMNFDTLDFNVEEAVEQEFSEQETTEVTEMVDTALPEADVDFGNILGADEVALESEMLGALETADMSSETSSRSGNSKGQLLKEYGGNSASEESVALALKWIVKHQLPDGGWSLDHTMGPGNFRDSPDPGNIPQARGAATALAILPLLGAGHTHQTGEYKDEVRRGLKFLMYRAKRAQRGLSYLEPGGSMYSHGLVSIALCEAYAMTKDPELVNYAQGTLWYIEQAQDPVGGGWRYQPRQPGDTSAVGWQLMALKSGKISGLAIQPKTYKLVEKFLDSVSTSGGAF
ncbi:MAG: terpene cyclase/mutase family protein, partial [Planctomycetaceae bacterium]|nr:terpene cyclase/mutase family protein [Planctomycetaceae bacterium]